MVRTLKHTWVKLAIGLVLPMAGSLAMADESTNDQSGSTLTVATESESAEPGLIPATEAEPTLASETAASDTIEPVDNKVVANEPVATEAAPAEEVEPAPLADSTQPTPIAAGSDVAPIEAADDAEPVDSKPIATEVIRERYPSTAIKIERHVAQDEESNYFNHGLFTQFDEKGRVIGTGEYRHGKRQGKWNRWYGHNEGPMFNGPMFKEFQAPFSSEVTFKDDGIHGLWKTFDAQNRKCSEWEFIQGVPHGKSVWFFPNGKVRREIVYKDGEIDGTVQEWNADGKIANQDKYMKGRRLAIQTDWYSPGVKRAEGWTLFARDLTKPNYDWWKGVTTVTVTGKDGVNQRHGNWTWWHKNGQKLMEGRYSEDKPIGMFTWWYANGQKQLQGEYITGDQHGRFVWWHENGQKQLDGEYDHGTQIGKWTRWNHDGLVAEVGDFGADGYKVQSNKGLEADSDASVPELQATVPAARGPRFKR